MRGFLQQLRACLHIPADKQNIVYTNRRSKETQDILQKILKAPEEIKVDKTKEQEVDTTPKTAPVPQVEKKTKPLFNVVEDKEALDLVKKYNSYNGKTPKFILVKGVIAEGEEK